MFPIHLYLYNGLLKLTTILLLVIGDGSFYLFTGIIRSHNDLLVPLEVCRFLYRLLNTLQTRPPLRQSYHVLLTSASPMVNPFPDTLS